MRGQRRRPHPGRGEQVVPAQQLGVPGQLGRARAAGELGDPLVLRAGQLGQVGELGVGHRAAPERLAEQVALLGAEVLGGGDGPDRPRGGGQLRVAELGRQRVGDGDQGQAQRGVPVPGQLPGLELTDGVPDGGKLIELASGLAEHVPQRRIGGTGGGGRGTEPLRGQVRLALRRGDQGRTGRTAPGAQRVGLGDLLLHPVRQAYGRGGRTRHHLRAPGVQRGVDREPGLHHAEDDQPGGGDHDRQQQPEPDRAQPTGPGMAADLGGGLTGPGGGSRRGGTGV